MKTLIDNGKINVYVSDIHGDIDSLLYLDYLSEWHNEDYHFVFGGDYVDGEKYGLEVLNFIKRECDTGWATAIMGNHDKMLLDFLREPNGLNKRQYFMNGGKATLKHMCGGRGYSAEHMATLIKEMYPDTIAWLSKLPTAFEDKHRLCVHAGIDWDKNNYHDTTDYDAMWLRDSYIQGVNTTGKTIITGHTPTSIVSGDKSCPVVLISGDKEGDRYLIDGGEHAQNHSLNVLSIDQKGKLKDCYKVGTDLWGAEVGKVKSI